VSPAAIVVMAANVPIWAGIGLILLSAIAGNALARRRNRRLLERYDAEHRE
jgi:UPF0716 family protein affecting phage T7 exclusion